MTPQTILIGLDGATFTILDPLIEQGVMPFLKSLISSGVRAELRSIVPALTPPAWTSLMTGRSPGHHGVFDFFQLDAPGSKQIRLATSNDVRCETIWSIANRHHLKTTVLNFPVMFPPPALDGSVIAGWMPWRQLRLGCYPPELYDRLKALPGFNARELAMDMALEAKATEGCAEDELGTWVDLHVRREQSWMEVLRELMQRAPADLTAILFDGPDKIQHLCWRFVDPSLWPASPTPQEQAIRDRCYSYFQQLDRLIAEIAELTGPDATLMVASDHGFGASTGVLHINSWLEQAGYLAWRDTAALDGGNSGALGMGHLARHTQALDWQRTTAYAATPTSNGIHIVVADKPGQPGIAAEDYLRFRAELIAALQQVTDPTTGEPIIDRIWTREEAFAGSAMALAPDLTLVMRDGGLVSILPADQPFKMRPKQAGMHRPNGVFMLRGPGVRQGLALPELSILDVAPTVLYSLGIGIPEQLEGRVRLEMFDPSLRSQRPIQIVPSAASQHDQPRPSYPQAAYDEEAEAIILDRLRVLGYIE